MAEISYRKELFVGRNSRAPDLASWPAGAFFTGNDLELGSCAADPRLARGGRFRPLTGRRTSAVGAKTNLNDEIPKVGLYRIAICIYVIVLIGLRGDTHKSSWDVATKPFSR